MGKGERKYKGFRTLTAHSSKKPWFGGWCKLGPCIVVWSTLLVFSFLYTSAPRPNAARATNTPRRAVEAPQHSTSASPLKQPTQYLLKSFYFSGRPPECEYHKGDVDDGTRRRGVRRRGVLTTVNRGTPMLRRSQIRPLRGQASDNIQVWKAS